ncbi:MAG TPA: MOSC domain-containing protein [Ilumatobacteraceae bacterium]|nr:MOSC domain-containing protein [Ilumatobacteraceae bacterium]
MYQVGPYEFTKLDARTTFLDLADLWREHLTGLPELPAAVGAFADVWADATADRIAMAAGEVIDPAAPVDRLDIAGQIAERCLASGAWTDAQVADALGAAWLGLRDVADALRDAGAFGDPSSGTVVQLNRSGGGVPKLPLPVADVDWGGVVGDVQANRRHHGRPWQALCLWDADVIDRFASEGHPIGYGSAGENVTIRGIEWGRVRPGVRLRLGTARCEASSYAVPCSQNAGWFVGRAFNLMHHDRGPVSRIYATVLEPGRIAPDDDVVLEP